MPIIEPSNFQRSYYTRTHLWVTLIETLLGLREPDAGRATMFGQAGDDTSTTNRPRGDVT